MLFERACGPLGTTATPGAFYRGWRLVSIDGTTIDVADSALARALLHAIGEICAELLPRRRLRAAARVVKRKMSSYGVRRAEHRAWPHPHLPVAAAIRILGPP